MKSAVLERREFLAEIIDFKVKRSEMEKKKTLQNGSEKKSCFQTDQRYFCEDSNCGCLNECKKLIAEWMR